MHHTTRCAITASKTNHTVTTQNTSCHHLCNRTKDVAKKLLTVSMIALAGTTMFPVAALAEPKNEPQKMSPQPQPRVRKNMNKAPDTPVQLTPTGEQLMAKATGTAP
jgi:hypothetical protein